jgi:excisionase family DNA binding protein
MTPEQIEELRRLRAEGASLRDLGRRFGVSRETVRKHTMDVDRRGSLALSRTVRKTWAAVDQAAERLGVSEATITTMCEGGTLPCVKLGARTWLVPWSSLPTKKD